MRIFKEDKVTKFIKNLEDGILRYAKYANEFEKEIKSKEEIAFKRYDEYKRTKAERYKQVALDTYASVKFDEGFFIIANKSVLLLTELKKAIKLGVITEQELDRIISSTNKLLSRNPIEWYRKREEFYEVYDDIKSRIPWPTPETPRLEKTEIPIRELERELEERWLQWKGISEEKLRKLPEPPKEREKEKA